MLRKIFHYSLTEYYIKSRSSRLKCQTARINKLGVGNSSCFSHISTE